MRIVKGKARRISAGSRKGGVVRRHSLAYGGLASGAGLPPAPAGAGYYRAAVSGVLDAAREHLRTPPLFYRTLLRRRSAIFIVSTILAGLIFLTLSFSNALAGDVGGYDVARIAAATVNVLKEKNVVSETAEKELAGPVSNWPSDPLAMGRSFNDFYARLGAVLIGKNIASENDINNAKTAAENAGGIKIGGLNPVVLAASYLDLLVRKGVLTLPAAQSILDSSRSR